MAKGDRLLRVTRGRVILPVAGAVWGAGAVMHAAHVAALDPALVSAAVAGVMYGTRARPLTLPAAAAGGWLATATAIGPLAGPHGALTWVFGTGTAAGVIALNRHEAVRKARQWRAARMEWLHTAHRYGLHGSHLLEHETTRLGDRRVFDVTGTGKLASQLASGSLAEQIAQDEGLPVSRVRVDAHRIAGRLVVSRRFRDPWKHPIPHPVLDSDPEIVLPVPATIRDPLVIGQDPETGDLLLLVVWDTDGAKNILVVGKKRSGKTVLLSCLRERVTAAADADLWNINLSKSVEDRDWAPACEYSACGPHERKKALAILRMARQLIDERGARPRDTPVFKPTAEDRLKVLVIDEIDALVTGCPAARADLAYIASKNGSEGVALVIAGQRGTADWMGGSNVRTQIDLVCIGKVNRLSEVNHAAGDMGIFLPNMATYGEGHVGVWVIAEQGGDYQAGRTFNLKELVDIRRIAADRSRTREPALTAPGTHHTPEASSDIGHLDTSMDDALPDDLRDQWRQIGERNEDTRRLLAETAAGELPAVPAEKQAESARARWDQVAEQTVIPDDARERLLALLAGEGTTITKAAGELGARKWTVRCWLERLRAEGVAEVVGQKRGARWRLTAQDGGGGT